MYEKAAQIPVKAPEQEFRDRWYRREFAAEENGLGYGGIDETKMSAKEREEYRQELKEQEQIQNENLHRAAKLVIEASRHPSCRFDVDRSGTPIPTDYDRYYGDRDQSWINTHSSFHYALALPLNVPFAELPPAEAVEFQLAALRLLDHVRQGQPTSVAYRVLSVERGFLARVVAWAENSAVPAADVQELLTQLQQYFRVAPIDPVAPFFADDRIVREVLLGTTPPLILAEEKVDYAKYLAFLANELPWERERCSWHSIGSLWSTNARQTNWPNSSIESATLRSPTSTCSVGFPIAIQRVRRRRSGTASYQEPQRVISHDLSTKPVCRSASGFNKCSKRKPADAQRSCDSRCCSTIVTTASIPSCFLTSYPNIWTSFPTIPSPAANSHSRTPLLASNCRSSSIRIATGVWKRSRRRRRWFGVRGRPTSD